MIAMAMSAIRSFIVPVICLGRFVGAGRKSADSIYIHGRGIGRPER